MNQLPLNTDSMKSAEQWCIDYCNSRRDSEHTINLELVEQYEKIQKASWMDPAPVRRKPGLLTRIRRFLGI